MFNDHVGVTPTRWDTSSTAEGVRSSELIEVIARRQNSVPYETGESAVKRLIELMSEALASGERIESRGFGSFSLHFRSPRVGRNPKTGEPVPLNGKYVAHFKPGKALRQRVDTNRENSQ